MTTSTYIQDLEQSQAVEMGLSNSPKWLPSWLLYDSKGDRLFEQIMNLPEYYPTRCEFQILHNHKEELAHYFIADRKPFNLIELGAGNGMKSEILLRALIDQNAKFIYSPIDISGSVLLTLSSRLRSQYPDLTIEPINASYAEGTAVVSRNSRNVVLFLGANIGNMSITEASEFISNFSGSLSARDIMVVGIDLKKEPQIIERAYNDRAGVTRQFNLNLLERLNKTMGATFDITQFEHYPSYNPETGTASSFLVSLKDQNVHIASIGKTFHFGQWETIHTEISQKYDLLMIDKLFEDAGLEIVDLFFDKDRFFCDVVVMKR